VGSTPLKHVSQNGNLPQIGVKIKKYLKPPPSQRSYTQKDSRRPFVVRVGKRKFQNKLEKSLPTNLGGDYWETWISSWNSGGDHANKRLKPPPKFGIAQNAKKNGRFKLYACSFHWRNMENFSAFCSVKQTKRPKLLRQIYLVGSSHPSQKYVTKVSQNEFLFSQMFSRCKESLKTPLVGGFNPFEK